MSSLLGKSTEIDIEARYATMNEKKRKRMQSNRESARRSRLKREKRIKDLINEIATLKEQILEGNKRCNDVSHKTRVLLSENDTLNSEKKILAHYLSNFYLICTSFGQKQIGCSSNQQWQETGPQKPIITTGMSKV
ncbi:hypothetical protein LWI28_004593 [Acer negundo]|uniref:BZIP domain-containing protein n=1 Tax=Acer negundo TaxID=4023 RepID=A0AAD5JCB3_ACENE|nr:hypothetical protein LWI28_004593 [Acer negundo]KAK4855498.1 hypothetical protein QYF36_008002 [Acer negundo]